MVTLGEMISEVVNDRKWYGASAPSAFQYFTLNVKTLGVLTEAQYEKDFPAWSEQIKADYAEIVAKRENEAKVLEAVKLSENEGIKFVAGLTKEQREKLMAMLTETPEPKVEAPKEEITEAPIMAMCEKCGKEMPMLEAKKVDGKMVGKCEKGHDMVAPVAA